MVFLPVCIFQFTRPRTFSPYIFNAKTLTQQLNTLPANIPVICYHVNRYRPKLIINTPHRNYFNRYAVVSQHSTYLIL